MVLMRCGVRKIGQTRTPHFFVTIELQNEKNQKLFHNTC